MKTLFFFLIGITFLTTNAKMGGIILKDIEPTLMECPECKAEFESCTDSIYSAYAIAVGNACDQFKKGKISKEDYLKACMEASKVMDKADELCRNKFQRCCLTETKEKMDEEKKREAL